MSGFGETTGGCKHFPGTRMAFDEMDGGNSGAAFATAVNDALAEEALTCWLRYGLHREFDPVTADPLPMEWLRMLEGTGPKRDEP